MNIFVRLGDWNEKANKGRGGVRASYGPEANRINSLLLARVYKIDSLLAEYQRINQQYQGAERVTALLGLSGIFGHDLAEKADFVDAIIASYQQLCEQGARECVAALSADA